MFTCFQIPKYSKYNLPRWQVVVMMIWEEPGLR